MQKRMMWTMIVRFGLFVNIPNRKLQCSFARFLCFTKSAMVFDRTLFEFTHTPYHYHVTERKLSTSKQSNYLIQHGYLLSHEVMENNTSYIKTVVLHPMKMVENGKLNRKVNAHGMFEIFHLATFHNLKKQRTLGEAEFTSMIHSLIREISNGSFNDIQLVLSCLCLWSRCTNSYVPNFKPLWNKLDIECTKRLKNWSIAQKLLIGDYFFHLRLSNISMYNKNMIKDLINSCNELTNSQFVQLMFFINLQKVISQHFFNILEKHLERILNTITPEELSVICLAFFNTDNKINNTYLLKAILECITSNIDNLDTASVVRLLKILSKSFQPDMMQHFRPLLKGCIVNMERFDLITVTHISMLCLKNNIFEPFLLDLIVEKFTMNIVDARLKDICKVVQCLSRFSYMPSSEFHEILFEEVMKEGRLEEAKKFPHHLVDLLLFYAHMGQYPLNIYEYVLNPNFVELCQSIYGDEILTTLAIIDCCIEIECSEYTGPRLKPNLLGVLKNYRNTLFTEDGSTSTLVNFSKLVMETVSRLTTPDNYVLRHVLPHSSNPDIIVRLSSNNTTSLQKITDACPSEVILRPNPDELWCCLIMCTPFSFAFGSTRLCGLIAMKERQLKKLGYRTILIPFKDFPVHDKNQESYLKKKLHSIQDKPLFARYSHSSE